MGLPPETALAVPAATPAEWRRAVDAVATDARRTAAATFDADALGAAGPDRWRAILADTPLAGVDPHLPVDHPLYVMAATVALAERAVHLALAGEEHPLVLAAAVARLVESSLRDFTDPRTGRTHRHLAGAKSAGAFFTPPDVALRMATAALAERPLTHRSVEPAGGTGMLTAALLVAAARLGRPVRSVEAWELSPYLARACAATLATVAERLGGGCQVRVAQVDALDRFAVAGSTARAGFDVVLLNPPYGRVKFLRSSLTNAETRARRLAAAERDARDRVQTMRARVARLATDLGLGRGTPDYQRLFIAGSYRLLSTGGRLVVIAPSAWTSGRDAADLREALFRRRALVDLTLYPEGCQLFPTVNQPTAIAVLDEAGGADGFQVTEVDPRTRTPRDSYRVGYDEVEGAGPNRWRVPLVPSPLRDAYRHLTGAPRFRDAAGARNARGELDLTLDAALVSVDATPVRLVRGDHVERFVLRGADESARAGYVTLDGLAEIHRRPKGADIDRPRVVGRQCSYLGKGRRLSFAAVPPGVVVGNSCNYVTTDDPDDVFAAVAILNSAVAEWWFRRRSWVHQGHQRPRQHRA